MVLSFGKLTNSAGGGLCNKWCCCMMIMITIVSPYCGEVYCVPSEECYTMTTSGGSWDGYVTVSQEWTGTGTCNGCTDYITDVYSNSSSDFCLETSTSNCADGEVEMYTYGSCEDMSYTTYLCRWYSFRYGI